MSPTLPPRRRAVRITALIAVLGGLVLAPASGVTSTKATSGLLSPAPAILQADGNNRNVRIHNQTGWTMTGLQASGSGPWGRDLLSARPLSPGNSVVVSIDDGSGACEYALRAAFDNGQSLQRTGINACEVADYYFTR